MLGVTCDNASNNDTMIESMAMILSNFSGEANQARCLAHIVNLVAKIILRQFDKPKKKKKTADKPDNLPENPKETDPKETDPKETDPKETDATNDANEMQEEEIEDTDDLDEERERVLDKEEKEMDEGDDEDQEDSAHLARDVEIMEEAMGEEIERVVGKVKPVRQVLYKVNLCLRVYSTSPLAPIIALNFLPFFHFTFFKIPFTFTYYPPPFFLRFCGYSPFPFFFL